MVSAARGRLILCFPARRFFGSSYRRHHFCTADWTFLEYGRYFHWGRI